MKVLFLDDDPARWSSFSKAMVGRAETIWAQTAIEAIEQLKDNSPFDMIFLDHDLGGKVYVASGEGTGWEVAKWIANNITNPPRILIHSMNPVGAKEMKYLLPNAEVLPFHMLLSALNA